MYITWGNNVEDNLVANTVDSTTKLTAEFNLNLYAMATESQASYLLHGDTIYFFMNILNPLDYENEADSANEVITNDMVAFDGVIATFTVAVTGTGADETNRHTISIGGTAVDILEDMYCLNTITEG